MEDWAVLKASDPLPPLKDIAEFSLTRSEYVGTQLNVIPKVHSEEEHEKTTLTLQSCILFGDKDLMECSEIDSFWKGYSAPVGPGGVEFHMAFFDLEVSPSAILAAQYSRNVECVDDIISILEFHASGFDISTIPKTTKAYITIWRNLFCYHLTEWMRGVGHPDHPAVRGSTVSEEDWKKEEGNELLRATSFLEAVTEFRTLPPVGLYIMVVLCFKDLSLITSPD